jgi:ribonuclease T1
MGADCQTSPPRDHVRTPPRPGVRALAAWVVAALFAVVVSLVPFAAQARGPHGGPFDRVDPSGLPVVEIDALPLQARETLRLIRAGGPFPYRKDGTVFGNRERLLPPRPRGHYTEYTVPTPRSPDRGARRIVAAGEPSRTNEFYYTDDHYQSFRRIREPG